MAPSSSGPGQTHTRRSPSLLAVAIAIVLVATGGIVAVGLTSAVGSVDPEKSIELTEAAAIDRVVAFADVPIAGVRVSALVNGASSRFYEVVGPDVVANVDVHDGRVIGLLLTTKSPTTSTVNLTLTDAIQVAGAFLSERDIPRAGLVEAVELVDRGDTKEYVVTWQAYLGDIVVPDARVVGVNPATGQVFRYLENRRPFVAPEKPIVDADAAIAAANATSSLGSAASVENIELRVAFDSLGGQRLVWYVYLQGPVGQGDVLAHAVIEVDAMTGETAVMGMS